MSLESILLKLLNMSVQASFLILAVILVRLIFRKAPRWILCILWGLVAIRLLFPFTIESPYSLLPSREVLPSDILYTDTPTIDSGTGSLGELIDPSFTESLSPVPGDSASPMQVVSFILTAVWVTGAALLLLYGIVSYFLVRRRVRESVPLRENIRLCDRIPSPFILGIFRPKIYLPSSLSETDTAYVIAHEQAHLKRWDHLWKPLGFALLTLHWFNPLVWIGYILLCRDIELACDEKVIDEMEAVEKKQYSEVLLACSTNRRFITACPLAFGEVGVKERIKNVLNYKKPAFWIIVLAMIASIVTAVCFLTTPPTDIDDPLAVFLDCQIAYHHQNDKSGDHYCALDYEVLGKRKRGDTVTVYMWVLYEEFSWDPELDGGIKHESGFHTPTVITAKKDGDHYTLIEYRTPRDGSYYDDDIREMFPWRLQSDALHPERFYKKQHQALTEMAYAHFQENLPLVTNSDNSTDVADIGGADKPTEVVETRTMTLRDVRSLSERGDTLMLADFEPFSGEFGGYYTPLSTRSFPINDNFRLYIGWRVDDTLAYVCLHAPLYDRTIDIRSENVTKFIEECKNPPAHVHAFSADPYYTTHTAVAERNYANAEDAPHIPLRYHEVYRDCSTCGYTEYLGWVYCGLGKGDSDPGCTGGCANTNRFDHISTKLSVEYHEKVEFPALLLSFESSENTENIRACIEENRKAYDTLLAHDDFLLRYIFKCFIAGGQTGLRGEILCELLKDLDPDHVLSLDADNGQMYFSAWKNSVKRVRDQHGDAWMEENYPTGALLLRMLNMR